MRAAGNPNYGLPVEPHSPLFLVRRASIAKGSVHVLGQTLSHLFDALHFADEMADKIPHAVL
jgi:hypothetical protein